MNKTQQAEVEILSRMLYLIEERSVGTVMQKDQQFASFITDIYHKLDARSAALRRPAATTL